MIRAHETKPCSVDFIHSWQQFTAISRCSRMRILYPGLWEKNADLCRFIIVGYRQFGETSFCLSNSAFDRNAFDKMYNFSGRYSCVSGSFHDSVGHLVGGNAEQRECVLEDLLFQCAISFCSMMSLYRRQLLS